MPLFVSFHGKLGLRSLHILPCHRAYFTNARELIPFVLVSKWSRARIWVWESFGLPRPLMANSTTVLCRVDNRNCQLEWHRCLGSHPQSASHKRMLIQRYEPVVELISHFQVRRQF